MKKMTKMLVTLLIALSMVLSPLVSAVSVKAAREPYCFPSYSHELGCNVVNYFEYGSDYASAVSAKRLILDGSTLRTGGGDTINAKYKAGSVTTWFNATKVAWQKTNDNVFVWDSVSKKNIKIASNADKILTNYDYFAAQVQFKDGHKEPISKLIKEAGSGYGTGSESSSSTTKEVKVSTDNGKTIVTFGGNTLVVEGSTVKLNNKKLSKYCTSGIRFVSITKENSTFFIWLYEDNEEELYKFDINDPNNPVPIQYSGELRSSAETDALGYGYKLITSTGKTKFSDLKEKEDVDDQAINKKTYSTLLLEDGTEKELRRKSNGLTYIDDLFVVSGIKNKSKQLGFADSKTITYVLNGNQYTAPISNPTNATLVKSNVKELVYAKDGTGWATGSK